MRNFNVFRNCLLVITTGLFGVTGSVEANLYQIGSGVTTAINNNNYTALTALCTTSSELYGARDGGGLDHISLSNGAWSTAQTVSNVFYPETYYAIAQNPYYSNSGGVWASRIGSLDWISNSTGVAAVRPITFTSLTIIEGGVYGVDASGNLNVSYWSPTAEDPGAWGGDVIFSGNYTSVVSPGPSVSQQSWPFGTRSGSLDKVYYSNGWQRQQISANTYPVICADATSNDRVYGASSAGLDAFTLVNGVWQSQNICSNNYIALTYDGATGSVIYGARSGGGLDRISWNGSAWVVTAIDTRKYSALAHDASSNIVYASNSFSAKLAYPCFRNSFQSKDPKQLIRVIGNIGSSFSGMTGLTVQGSLLSNSNQQQCWTASVSVSSASDYVLQQNITMPAVGDYTLTVNLLSSSSSVLASQTHAVHVLSAASTEVTFDENHICYVNGSPFFPIALSHVGDYIIDTINNFNVAHNPPLPVITTDSMLADVKNHGFNTAIHGWLMPTPSYLQSAANHGLYVIPEVGMPSSSELDGYVSTANSFNNVLMWWGKDEPTSSDMPNVVAAYDRFKVGDSHRPVSGALTTPALFDAGIHGFDFIMNDIYPCNFPNPIDFYAVGWFPELGIAASDGLMPHWAILQAFTVTAPGITWTTPTPGQIRCQAYQSIVHGATGLVWYANWTSEAWADSPVGRPTWYLPDVSSLWDYFPTLNAELSDFTPVIMNGELVTNPTCSNWCISMRTWSYNDEKYLLAVNPYLTTESATFSNISYNGQVMVKYENRNLTASGNSFTDSFSPLSVHVYKLPKVSNNSFELNNFTIWPGYVSSNGPISCWTSGGSGRTGLNALDATAFANNGVIPDGSHVAFLETYNGQAASLSQPIHLLGMMWYALSYYENARVYNSTTPTLSVTLGGTTLIAGHTITPVDAAATYLHPYQQKVVEFFVPTDGDYTLSFNASNSTSSAVLLDNVTVSNTYVIINSAATYTNSTIVSLAMGAPAVQMSCSNDGTTWTDWEPYANLRGWAVSAGDGAKTVYGWFRNASGKITYCSDTIILDATFPIAGTSTCSSSRSKRPITVSRTGASDSGSGLQKVELWYKKGSTGAWTNSGLTNSGATGSFSFRGTSGPATYYFDLVAQDVAGNRSAVASGNGDCSCSYTGNP